MSKKKISCIRLLADEVQIRQCKEELREVGAELESVAAALNLAGNAVRLKILYLLKREEEMCPCDLSDVLNMTVPAISQHLRKLKDGGLVENKKIGQTVFYALSRKEKTLLDHVFNQIESSKKIAYEK